MPQHYNYKYSIVYCSSLSIVLFSAHLLLTFLFTEEFFWGGGGGLLLLKHRKFGTVISFSWAILESAAEFLCVEIPLF
jgi:hypothetical protein